jgi:hypothetical protein
MKQVLNYLQRRLNEDGEEKKERNMKTCVACYRTNEYSFTRFYHVPGEEHFQGVINCRYPSRYPVGNNLGTGTQYTNRGNGTLYIAYHLPALGSTPEESREILRQYVESRNGALMYGKPSRWNFEVEA